jgi:hypothetical protein
MMRLSLSKFLNRLRRAGRPAGAPAARRRPTRPLTVEPLEDRTLPASLLSLVSPPNVQLPASDSAGGLTGFKISADGRFIAYSSTAPNLVAGQVDTAVAENTFLYDQQTSTTTLVSHVPTSATTGANGNSQNVRVSGDGRFVLYESFATNLVAGQNGPSGQNNVFLYDRTTGRNTLVSHRFDSATTTGNDSASTFDSTGFGFGSGTGRFLLYNSKATDLVSGQNGPVHTNLFLYDTTTGLTTLISHTPSSSLTAVSGDTINADLTPDGNFIVYQSFATDVVDQQSGGISNIFLYDRASNTTQLVSGVPVGFFSSSSVAAGSSFEPLISADGRTVAYLSDATDLVPNQSTSATFNARNVFVYDTSLGTNSLVSGANGSASQTGNSNSSVFTLSSDGSTVAFVSDATNLTSGQGSKTGNAFLYTTSTGALTLVSHTSDSTATAAGGVYNNVTNTYADLNLTDDGRFLAYLTTATNVEQNQPDTLGYRNAFVWVRSSNQNLLASHVNGSSGTAANQNSYFVRMSADGSALVFLSLASNLDPPNNIADGGANIFLTTSSVGPLLLSRSAFRASATSLVYGTSGDGRFVLYSSNDPSVVANQNDTNHDQDLFLLDRTTGTTILISHIPTAAATAGDHGSPTTVGVASAISLPVISADGNFVAFVSQAGNLVTSQSGTITNEQVFLFNRLTGTIKLLSHKFGAPATTANDFSSDPAISADGHYVAFRSNASNLISGGLIEPAGEDVPNVYLYDTVADTITLVSHAAGNASQSGSFGSVQPSISDDGRFVAYWGLATDLVAGSIVAPTNNVYLYDRTTGANTLVSHTAFTPAFSAGGSSTGPVLSADGNYVAFVSFAPDLVDSQGGPTDRTNVYLYNRLTGKNILVSGFHASASITGNGYSDSPAINQDGTLVAFRSTATDLIAGQVGGGSNIFLFYRQAATPTVTLVSHRIGAAATAAGGDSTTPVIDADGSLVAYLSTAPDLVPNQSGGGVNNVFGYARRRGVNFLVSGQDGSITAASAVPTFQPVISRHSIIGFSGGGGLVPGASGTTNVYANALVQISFTAAPLAVGNPVPTRAGTVTIDSFLKGQDLPPLVSLPAGMAPDNDKFQFLDQVGIDGTVPLWTRVVVGQASLTFFVSADVGLDQPAGASFTLTADPPPPLTVTITKAANQTDPGGGPALHFTVTFNRPVGDFTAQDVSLSGMTGLTDTVSGSGTTYDVAVSGMGGPGPVTAWVPGGVAHDGFGTANQAAPALAGVSYDPTAPPGALYGVAQAFSRSREHYVDFLGKAYRQYLKREPDATGLNFWVGAMLAGTYSDEQVEAFFIGSDEYINFRYHGDLSAWVQGMYQDLLLRPASAAEVAQWLAVLGAGTPESAVALGFAASPEREQLRIADSYRTFLGREPSAGEVSLWLDAFEHGLSNEDLVAGFVGSKEYYVSPQKGQDDRATWVRRAYLDVLARAASDGEVALWLGILT